MAITRTVDWKLLCQPEEALDLVQQAITKAELEDVQTASNQVRASAKRSLRKNRWAAEVNATVNPLPGGSEVVWQVEMSAGTKHFEVLDDIAEHVPEEKFDDQGIKAAVERLGKAGRFFGRKEVRHLHNVIRSSERVVELGQGNFDGKQGIIVLTSERLFFYEKSMMGTESMQEFALPAIQALSVSKKLTGERIEVAHSGTRAEITNMGHGQADIIVRAFHQLRRDATALSLQSDATARPDPMEQLQRLAQLREQGIITAEEFDRKKSELLDRL
jgi:hypothetical protein